ncbi:MAG: formylglycine-generating enzyme family protein [Bdellovibrionota bacterium]
MKALALFLLCFSAAAAQSGTLVKVPGGVLEPFWIAPKQGGSAKPELISIAAFASEPHAVTNEDFLRFLREHPEWRKSKVSPLFAEAAYLSQFSGDLRLRKGVKARAPVTYVSWFAALAYCEQLGLRLPTVNEWEYMAAASETKTDANRDPEFLARILEWYGTPKAGELQAVKSTYRNRYGLYDLHALVWEWTEDFNSGSVGGESGGDAADKNLSCGTGSLFGANKENYAAFMRFAYRSSLKGKSAIWNLGFRCVR